MSVRRLAEAEVQPQGFAFTAENAAWAQKRIALYPEGRQQSAVIPLLMRAQEQEGWISKAAIELIADMLSIPYIRVLEVATFYTQFQLEPVGTRAHVQVCGTTPCMLRGAEDLRKVCQRKIHPEAHHLNADGTLSWEEVECLGACVNAPMIAIGPHTYEDLTPARLEEILDAYANGKGETIPTGPQNGRRSSEAITGQTTLLEVPHPGEGKAAAKAKKAAKPAAKAGEGEFTPLFETPAGDKDDLKLIAGVGPVLEGKLNALGITRYDQIAAFSKDEIDRLDEVLNFKGRITRDDWLKQADALARGGAEEYIRVFGKKPR